MDPNVALEAFRACMAAAREHYEQEDSVLVAADLEEATMHAEALDEWLSKGGFLPTAWQPEVPTYEPCAFCGDVTGVCDHGTAENYR